MCRKGYDREKAVYRLTYLDGPYLSTESPDGAKLLTVKEKADTVVKFKLHDVKPAFISVSVYDNYNSSWPVFIVFMSLVQIVLFVYYCCAVVGVGSVSLYTPASGPQWSWLSIISDFPKCNNLSTELWRFFTYQFVHDGNHLNSRTSSMCLNLEDIRSVSSVL